ncbi:nucleotide disphospho-sugar-binding domain-containing protein [Roseiconus lacunae]|uniref:nucleotide disphospho-sugar-binding domain-containing protein n=1 Tax=Roseiconus lacunae TaxID=2605694 RepID=UPI00308702FB|nr:nucleotide disphospho-sugar-binding domain-containing protein [Stieleria sp. HD01]
MTRLAILSAPGSRGDVNPMVAIGAELRRRGFDVMISLAAPYADIARQADLIPHSLIDEAQFEGMLADPSMWKLLRGMRRVIRGIASDFLTPHFELIRRHYRPGKTVLVSHPLDFGSRIFRDVEPSVALVDIHLAPVMLRVPNAPARLTPWRFEPTADPRTFRLAYWLGDQLILDRLLAAPINRIRRQFALTPVRRIMHRWWLSPDRVLACYPDWFAPSTVGAADQLVHVGFPLSDGTDEPFEAPRDKPVVFTGGTANWHTQNYFRTAADACVQMGIPGILLGNHPQCFPQSLPPGVRAQSYTPLGKLLPFCRAIVHHGGIGTTSQALAAGIPQLIRAMAFDQFDNAARVESLSCGVRLRNDRDLASELRWLLQDDSVERSVARTAQLFDNSDPVERAADEIENVMTVGSATT